MLWDGSIQSAAQLVRQGKIDFLPFRIKNARCEVYRLRVEFTVMYEVGFELHLIDGWDSKRQENMGWHKDMKIGICLAFFFSHAQHGAPQGA